MEFSQEQQQIQQWLKLIDNFYKSFGWLADSFILDFHTDSHWSKLPQKWREHLESVSPIALGNWLCNENGLGNDKDCSSLVGIGNSVCPLGLQAFRHVIKKFSLSRKAISVESCIHLVKSSCELQNSEDAANLETQTDFEIIFKKHVKQKKQHEIRKLSKLITTCSEETHTNNIIDIGSGLGHLSRYLSYCCGKSLTCVDCSEPFISSARKLDCEIEKRLSHIKSKSIGNSYQNEVKKIQKPLHLTMMLSMGQEINLNQYENYGFIGLHTCGNLSPLILSSFLNSPKSKFVVSVGCCFMKLGREGYPMSKFVKKETNLRFSYEAFEVACHAIEDYAFKLKTSDHERFKIHNYRATLEYLIAQKYPHLRRSGLRGVRNFESKGFKEYSKEATAGLNIRFDDNEMDHGFVKEMLADWWKVVSFYSLRILMAQVIETTILLDRLLYLRENKCSSTVLPIFDGKISPRNFAIIGLKSSTKFTT